MDKANIIISIIIVLCVAAAVAAYGITNSDSPIFSDLSSITHKIRPIIKLNIETVVLSGTGTKNDPLIVGEEGDNNVEKN